MVLLQDLKKGDYFILPTSKTPTLNNVWVKGEYSKSAKKYICYKFSDVNHDKLFKGLALVNTDFEF